MYLSVMAWALKVCHGVSNWWLARQREQAQRQVRDFRWKFDRPGGIRLEAICAPTSFFFAPTDLLGEPLGVEAPQAPTAEVRTLTQVFGERHGADVGDDGDDKAPADQAKRKESRRQAESSTQTAKVREVPPQAKAVGDILRNHLEEGRLAPLLNLRPLFAETVGRPVTTGGGDGGSAGSGPEIAGSARGQASAARLGFGSGSDASADSGAAASFAASAMGSGSGSGAEAFSGSPNIPPSASDDFLYANAGEEATVNVLANDSDPDFGFLTISSFQQETTHGSVTQTGGSAGPLAYTATAGYSGPDSFTYTISDGQGGSATATVWVDVTNGSPINTPPSVTNPGDQTSTAGETISLSIAASDADNDPLTFTATGLPDGLSIDSTTGEITGSIDLAEEGDLDVTVSVFDGAATTDVTFRWMVEGAAPNQDPVATDDTATTANTPVDIDVLANDTDSDGGTLEIGTLSTPSKGTVEIVTVDGGQRIRYTPDSTHTGSATFTYELKDGQGGTDSGTVTLTVTNEAPVITPIQDQQDVAGAIINLQVSASDPDNDKLTYSDDGLAALGLSISATTGKITGTIKVPPTGAQAVTITVKDGRGGEAYTSFNWAVTANLPKVSITASEPYAYEQGPTSGRFVVTRSGGNLSEALTVYYAVENDSTATPGADYASLTMSVEILAGATTAEIEVAPFDDSDPEVDETVHVKLVVNSQSNATYEIVSPEDATVTIADNGDQPQNPGPQVIRVEFMERVGNRVNGTLGDLTHDNPTGQTVDGVLVTPDFKGGDRFFPDAVAPTRGTYESRNIVRVRAELTGVTNENAANTRVYFRSFDVDDPSSNDSIDRNGSAAVDNRGQITRVANDPTGNLWTQVEGEGYQGLLRPILENGNRGEWANGGDARANNGDGGVIEAVIRKINGKWYAEADLATSFAPGDNFRVVASTNRAEVEALRQDGTHDDVPTLDPASGGQPQRIRISSTNRDFTGAATVQLSVWRYMNVEHDRMQKTEGDTVRGSITSTAPGLFGVVEVNVSGPQMADIGVDEFDGGILRVTYKDGSFGNFPIVGNGANTGTTATFSIQAGGTSLNKAKKAEIFADDYFAPVGAGTVTAVALGNGQATLTTDLHLSNAAEAAAFAGGMVRINGTDYPLVRIEVTPAGVVGSEARIVIDTTGRPAPGQSRFLIKGPNQGAIPLTRVDTTNDAGMFDRMQATTNRQSNLYADAYIQPRYDLLTAFNSGGARDRKLVKSEQNIEDSVASGQLAIAGRQDGGFEAAKSRYLEGDLFWAVYVTTAYQGPRAEDQDGTDPEVLYGVSYEDQFAFVFYEAIREGAIDANRTFVQQLSATTAHEVGHQFGLDHRDGTLMDGQGLRIPETSIYFDPLDVREIRGQRGSPGDPSEF